MACTFYLKGDSLTPFKYGTFDSTNMPGEKGTNSIDVDGTSITGSIINLDQGVTTFHSLLYPGLNNLPTGAAISVVLRCKFGAALVARGLWSWAGYAGVPDYNLCEGFINSGDAIGVYAQNQAGAAIDMPIFATTGTGTTAWHDIVYTFDGTTDANKVQIWEDGSTLVQTTATNANTNHENGTIGQLFIGAAPQVNILGTRMKIDEFAIFDTEIDPATDGLDGASRTSSLETIYSISQTVVASSGVSAAKEL